MKKAIVIISAVFATVFAAGPALSAEQATIEWKNAPAAGGVYEDFGDDANWSLPEGRSIAYDPDYEYVCRFMGKGSVTYHLTLNEDFWINRIYLQSQYTKYDFNLGGHKLRLVGRLTTPITHNQGQVNQKFTLTNGALDFDGANRKGLWATGTGNILACVGTVDNPFVITNAANFQPQASSGGQLLFTNVVFSSTPKFQVAVGVDGLCVVSGPATKLVQNTDLFGPTSSRLEISGGAKVYSDNNNGSQKTIIVSGDSTGGNVLTVRGEGTELVSTNSAGFGATAGNYSISSVAVGQRSSGNRLEVLDGALLQVSGRIMVGQPGGLSAERASACNNSILISNAVVRAGSINLGETSTRGDRTYYVVPCYTNNTCLVTDGAKVYLSGLATQGLRNGYLSWTTNCVHTVEKGAWVQSPTTTIGENGYGNGLHVDSGAVLYSDQADTARGLFIGGVNSAASFASVDGGIIANTNSMVNLKGSMAGSQTTFEVKNGGFVRTRYLRFTGTNNVISIDNASVVVGTEAWFPRDSEAGDTVELRIAGANPLLSHLSLNVNGQPNPALKFGSGAKLSFTVPAGGYAAAPIQGVNGISISGEPTMAFDGRAFKGESVVLMDAGENKTISVTDAAFASLKDSFAESCGNAFKLKLVDGKRRLAAVRRAGFVIYVR